MTQITIRSRGLKIALKRNHVPEIVTAIVCLGSMFLGIDLMVNSDDYLYNPVFETATDLASTVAWGALLFAPSLASLVILVSRREDLYWPLFAMTVWFSAWAVCLVLDAPDPDVVNSAVIVYGMLSALMSIMASFYAREAREGGRR